jgi:hypothetical protein
MLILLAKKSPFLGYLMLIFTVRDFFFEVLLLFHIPYLYRVLFCALLSWLKKLPKR